MRDPQGHVTFEGSRVLRHLTHPADTPAFLTQPQARQMAEAGLLVPFEMMPGGVIESPRYSFVSLPTEWSDGQHRAAADATLAVAEQALAGGFELKDATAWNIIFEGSVPRFCDHLSFEPVRTRQWWAFGQFCRHFTFPLACAHWRGMHTHDTFAAHRDGLSAEQARQILGLRGRFSRLAPLLRAVPQGPAASAVSDSDSDTDMQPADRGTKGSLHQSVIDFARLSLLGGGANGGTSHRAAAPSPSRPWLGYVEERTHYPEAAVQAKKAQVQAWLQQTRPERVLDLGCNTGEFSHMALAVAQRVIAIDADHDSVQQLFAQSGASTRLHPLVAHLGDLHGGRGWAAAEFPGLLERLRGASDMVFMLALVHHLHFSEGIPLPEIAALAAQLCSGHLIVEMLDGDDPMARRLAAQRRRDTQGFSVAEQLKAFGAHFDLVQSAPLDGTRRTLVLMTRKA